MVRADIGVIGGTGVGELLRALGGRSVTIPTAFGPARGILQEREGLRWLVVQRHSAGHKTPPHGVNYRAMARAMRQCGVVACFSTAAVGSLRADWGPGTMAVCTGMLDLTFRNVTVFEVGVEHTPMDPIYGASGWLAGALAGMGETFEREAVYVGMNGPRYETAAEIQMLMGMGGDVVGMTASTEAVAMRESGVAYGCLSVVTNLGCGLVAEEIDHGAVVDVMKSRGAVVLEALTRAGVAAAAAR